MLTGKLNNRFPFLDILGYLKNTPKKSQIWQSDLSPNHGIPKKFPSSSVALKDRHRRKTTKTPKKNNMQANKL